MFFLFLCLYYVFFFLSFFLQFYMCLVGGGVKYDDADEAGIANARMKTTSSVNSLPSRVG